MLALAFFEWWYGPGWKRHLSGLQPRLRHTYQSFSVPQLLATLFSPWRRIVTPGGGSIGDRLRAIVDNAVSRCVGFIVRIVTVVTALVTMLFWLLEGIITAIIWPFLPAIGVALIIWGFVQ